MPTKEPEILREQGKSRPTSTGKKDQVVTATKFVFDAALSTAVAANGQPQATVAVPEGPLTPDMLDKMNRYWHAANYLCIGQIYHEDPQVLHYGHAGAGMKLQKGMTFTVEPMVNAGKPYTRLLPACWPVVTKDYSLSVQWEHTIAVTDDGYDILIA